MRLRAVSVTGGVERIAKQALRFAILLFVVCLVGLSAICVQRYATVVVGRFFLNVKSSEGKIWLYGAAIGRHDNWEYIYAKIAEDFNVRLWNTSTSDVGDWHGFRYYGSNEPLRLAPRSNGSTHYGIDDVTFAARSAFVTLPTWFCFVVTALPPAAYIAASAFRLGRTHARRVRGLCLRCGYDLRATPGTCPECGSPGHAAT